MPLSYAQIEQRRAAGRARAAKLTSAEQSRFGKLAVEANQIKFGKNPRGKYKWHSDGGKAAIAAALGAPRLMPEDMTRRKLLKFNGGSHTKEEWEALKARSDYKCMMCHRQEPQICLTKDHVIAAVRGGTDDIKNIQPLCGSCNSRKNCKPAGWYQPHGFVDRIAEQAEYNQLRLEHLLAGD